MSRASFSESARTFPVLSMIVILAAVARLNDETSPARFPVPEPVR